MDDLLDKLFTITVFCRYAQILMAIRSILPMSINLKYDEVIQSLFDALGAILLPNNVTVAPIVAISASMSYIAVNFLITKKLKSILQFFCLHF